MEDRHRLNEIIEDKLLNQGMPRHCGLCVKFKMCSRMGSEKICKWLKKRNMIIQKLLCLVILFLFPLTFAHAAAPTLEAVSPAEVVCSVDASTTISAQYDDADGWMNIKLAYIHINATTNKKNSFYAYYNRSTNKLFLRNDANTSWGTGYSPGTSNIIENSYARLDCSQTSVIGSGTTLTVRWAVSFKEGFLGSKNIYLYVKDAGGQTAGWTQKGSCAIIGSGTIIGPEGGEVASSDGKAKLIIPPGSLSSSRGIEVSIVNNDLIEEAAPNGTALLNAVECKPYGLVFNLPVSLVYSLSSPQIPGTPVALGLYDSVQGVINLTGQTSVISEDGYSVTFSLDHFSTYAALINLISQGAPIGGGVKVPLPDMLTGTFSHAFAFAIPPGRKGLQPNLALSYRSSNQNSWVGMGFSLNPGYIMRSTRLGPPSYIDTQDTFYLVTDAGTTELVHLIDSLYQAKVESSFTRFYKEADDSWRALAKDGSVLRFGETGDSRESSALGTFSWYLTKARDTNGNYVQYAYAKDEGKTYLGTIDYTGHEDGASPTNSVEFILESRDDRISSYLSGFRILTSKRLKEIHVKVNNDMIWRYDLEYEYSPDTGRSVLKSFRQCSGEGVCMPAQVLGYQGNE